MASKAASNGFGMIMGATKRDSGSAISSLWKYIGGKTVYARREHRPCVDSKPMKALIFDLDGTLVVPKDGRAFPNSRSDWKWLYPDVPSRLKALYSDGFDIVIISNQKNLHKIDNRYKGLSVLQRIALVAGKIDDMAVELGIPVSAYLSFEDNLYRKPARGMFDLMLDAYYDQWPTPDPQGDLVDLAVSAYVGDAAGRPKGIGGAGSRKDHADTDKAFAENAGLRFFTPEEFFLNRTRTDEHKWEVKSLLPSALNTAVKHTDTLAQILSVPALPGPVPSASDSPALAVEAKLRSLPAAYGSQQHVVMLSGSPASGKSSICAEYFPDYAVINQDELKTQTNCLKAMRAALDAGKNVIIDRTHGNQAQRDNFTSLCRERKIPIHFLRIVIDKRVVFHMNKVRSHHSRGTRENVPSIVIHSFFKNMQDPSKEEGFASITSIPWWPRMPGADSFDHKHVVPASPSIASDDTVCHKDGPHAEGTGHVSRSRTFKDYFFQRL
jgi:bifunctional polynucleotide phosphatase/kinase